MSARGPQQWTAEHAAQHLSATFDIACRTHPDLMEPFVTRLGDAADAAQEIEIKRAGLRETIRQRYPQAQS